MMLRDTRTNENLSAILSLSKDERVWRGRRSFDKLRNRGLIAECLFSWEIIL